MNACMKEWASEASKCTEAHWPPAYILSKPFLLLSPSCSWFPCLSSLHSLSSTFCLILWHFCVSPLFPFSCPSPVRFTVELNPWNLLPCSFQRQGILVPSRADYYVSGVILNVLYVFYLTHRKTHRSMPLNKASDPPNASRSLPALGLSLLP